MMAYWTCEKGMESFKMYLWNEIVVNNQSLSLSQADMDKIVSQSQSLTAECSAYKSITGFHTVHILCLQLCRGYPILESTIDRQAIKTSTKFSKYVDKQNKILDKQNKLHVTNQISNEDFIFIYQTGARNA